MGIFGCELCRIDNCNIDMLCMAWHRAIKRMWPLPPTTHGDLLPLLSDLLPLHDDICCCSLSFIMRCRLHQASLVRNMVLHGVLYARALSPVGRNALFCWTQYCFCYQDFISGWIDSQLVKRQRGGIVSDDNISAANLVKELIDLHERMYFFAPNPSFLMQSEIS